MPTSKNFGQLLHLSDAFQNGDIYDYRERTITLKELPIVHLWHSKHAVRLDAVELVQLVSYSEKSSIVEDMIRFSYWKCFADAHNRKNNEDNVANDPGHGQAPLPQPKQFDVGGPNRKSHAWNDKEFSKLMLDYIRAFQSKYF